VDKIAFLYLSPITAGKVASGKLHPPEPWVYASLPSKISFDVTFGLVIKLGVPYKVEIDVFYQDISILNQDRTPVTAEPVIAKTTNIDDYVSVENMPLMDVEFTNYGVHKLVASLYGYKDNFEEPITTHSLESFFYVSKEWKS